MDNAITTSSNGPLHATAATWRERMGQMPLRSLFALGVGLAALLAIAITLTVLSTRGDYKVLFAGLSDKDGGAVVAQLTQMNVPYRMGEGGSAILVPAAQVHEVRLKLASAGLPRGGGAGNGAPGFELMDNARFGQTQFQERTTFQRALEGELARSIGSLAAVASARVHLSLPNQNGFFREQQKPGASVLLTLHPGRVLERAQLAGIVHLVSSSVPELSPKAVSVVDQEGALLSGNEDAQGQAGLDSHQLQYLRQVESQYLKRVVDILEPVVGRDNLRANVTAEIDFAQIEQTSEEFKPNQGEAPAAVRSRQTSEANNPTAASPSGVPGAASNQPPASASAPLQGPAQALTAGNTGNPGALGMNPNARRDNVTNYEVDKTVKVVRNASGNIKRINAAVLLNHRTTVDPKGKTNSVPLSNDELEKLTALVQQSLGFNKERGDSVRVVNFPFKADTAPKAEEAPVWNQPWLLDTLRVVAAPLGLLLMGWLVFARLIKPALETMVPPPPPAPVVPEGAGGQLNAVVGDEPNEVELAKALAAPENEEKILRARTLAKENPTAVAQLVRGWVSGEEAKA
jgi:flagellar M-ring protein FliF